MFPAYLRICVLKLYVLDMGVHTRKSHITHEQQIWAIWKCGSKFWFLQGESPYTGRFSLATLLKEKSSRLGVIIIDITWLFIDIGIYRSYFLRICILKLYVLDRGIHTGKSPRTRKLQIWYIWKWGSKFWFSQVESPYTGRFSVATL